MGKDGGLEDLTTKMFLKEKHPAGTGEKESGTIAAPQMQLALGRLCRILLRNTDTKSAGLKRLLRFHVS